eukprot:sb/3470893/
MPLTRSAAAKSSTTTRAKGAPKPAISVAVPKSTLNRKRACMGSPGGVHKHCTGSKRAALGDITNKVIAEELAKEKAANKGKGKKAFTVFEAEKPSKKPQPTEKLPAKVTKVTNYSEPVEKKPDLGYRDIDAEITDPALSPEYANEIFINLKERELHFSVGDYLPRQTDITRTMRAILIDWLVEVKVRVKKGPRVI